MAGRIDAFLAMLSRGQDSAMLRFSLGNEYLAAERPNDAIEHLRAAVRQDANYSAAWKLLGKALAATGEDDEAATAFESGIRIAGEQGDRQAAKEMEVFLKRLNKKRGSA